MAAERSLLRVVGGPAVMRVAVTGVSGLLGIFTSRMIISNFGPEAYAQYGLLTTMMLLLPFADLGIAAVLVNAIAEAEHPRTDERVRRTITTALRVLCGSGGVIALVGVVLHLLGWWPVILGSGLMDGGSLAAAACMVLFGIGLPLSVGQRALLGLQRTTTTVTTQLIIAPFILGSVLAISWLGLAWGQYLAVLSFVAAALVSVICLAISSRLLSPQVGAALLDVPRWRTVPGVRVADTAWPMLIQMLALPLAMQTDRILISHLADPQELARYNLASQLFGLVLQAVSTAGMALWPIYARARAGARLRSPVVPSLVFGVGGLVAGLALAVVSPWVAAFVSHDRIQLDGWLIGGFVAFIVVTAVKYPVGMYMTDPAGLRFQVPPILVMVVLNLGLSWWWVLQVGAAGAILGSAVTVAVFQVLPNYWYVGRDLARRRAALTQESAEPVDA